ncbi:hypothetical protein F9C07_1937 [Aspergillus flavus]|uniref:Uncharacterized protein n=1 Tax=Aspergillus flavus (strain ATCC 200026 / FGSC A1120 / IAM 13836 / NRRL 3357 / JCM 12722 / SRRC 167) TaxID=332952 RepID=A0A7U2MG60_ASPFN|nr:hypothetical protein F9C07_1937 [Aspergillus flavus]
MAITPWSRESSMLYFSEHQGCTVCLFLEQLKNINVGIEVLSDAWFLRLTYFDI